MAIDQTTDNRITTLENTAGIPNKDTVVISKAFDTNQNLEVLNALNQLFTLVVNEPLSINHKILLYKQSALGYNGIYLVKSETSPLTYIVERQIKSTDLKNAVINLDNLYYKVIQDKNENGITEFFLSKFLDYSDILKALDLKEDKANKGVANGYAGLDATGKVPLNQLPNIASSIATLSDVALDQLKNNDVLIYNSSLTKWENKSIQDFAGGEVVPIGALQGYYGNTIPAGYLLCDGSTFNAVDYPDLNTFLGSNILPDSRGYFFRGLGGVDPDGGTRTLGSIQQDEFKSHSHQLPVDQLPNGTNYAHVVDSGGTDEGFTNDPLLQKFTDVAGGLETRPKNIAINYMIKAKHNPASAYNLVAGAGISITKNEVDKTATISSTGYTDAQIDTALNLKENTITAGTTAQYFRGDKTWQTLDKSAVGLSNVDNTTDLLKPISTATQTALNLKANSSDVYTKTETYTKAEVDTKITPAGVNFGAFSRNLTGVNITINAGSNTPSNITDDIFANVTIPTSFANVFTYSSGVLLIKNTIRDTEINFDVAVGLSYNGGQSSQFEVRIVNASTSAKIVADQFTQSTNLQSTQPQKITKILPMRLPANALGNDYTQTVGFRIEVIQMSTAVGVTITGIDARIRQVSSYQ